jgi:predicted DNA-binding transcriptional regulator AlpA
MNEQFLTTADLAKLTRSPESTIRYWRHVGAGPRGFRVGRRVLYLESEVRAWLAGLQEQDGAK